MGASFLDIPNLITINANIAKAPALSKTIKAIAPAEMELLYFYYNYNYCLE